MRVQVQRRLETFRMIEQSLADVRQAIFTEIGSAAPRRDIRKAMNHGDRVAAGVQELSIPIVVVMPKGNEMMLAMSLSSSLKSKLTSLSLVEV
jgi:hypothetical protein